MVRTVSRLTRLKLEAAAIQSRRIRWPSTAWKTEVRSITLTLQSFAARAYSQELRFVNWLSVDNQLEHNDAKPDWRSLTNEKASSTGN